MFNKKMLAASMAVAMTTGGMVAQTNAMQVAANDIGQVLLGGGYFVENGYSTDLVVVNTRTDAAVKAKVVFRSHLKSREVLDFFIYLTPGDTFRANLTLNGDVAHINSTDDSVRNAADTDWGNVDALDADFFTDKLDHPSDSNTFGHIEIISILTAGEGTYAAATITGSDVDIDVYRTMPKDDAKTLLDGGTRSTSPATHCTPAELDADDVISTSAPCATELSGEVIIKNDNNRASYKPTALAFNGTKTAGDSVAETNAAGYVIANTALVLTTGSESLVGGMWAYDTGERVMDVETALSANIISFPWESNGTDQGTDVLVSFVTKYRHENDGIGLCGTGNAGARPATATDHYSAPFADTEIGGIETVFYSLNNSEEMTITQIIGNSLSGGEEDTPDPTIIPNEVNYLQPAYMTGEESGWAYYNLIGSDADTCDYKAVPVVAHTYKYELNSDFRHMLDTTSNKNENN